MVFYSVIVSALLVCAVSSLPTFPGSLKSSKDAAILAESRYLSTAGQFGTSYVQDDGVEFKEESDAAGNRKGLYSYVDPEGKKRVLSYTAGIDGFQVSADHLPVAPVPVAPVPSGFIPAETSYISPVGYQLQSHISPSAKALPESVQFQYQTIVPQPQFQSNTPEQLQQSIINPVPILNEYQPPPVFANPEPVARHYPAGKLNLNQSPDGFSYTFNTIV